MDLCLQLVVLEHLIYEALIYDLVFQLLSSSEQSFTEPFAVMCLPGKVGGCLPLDEETHSPGQKDVVCRER